MLDRGDLPTVELDPPWTLELPLAELIDPVRELIPPVLIEVAPPLDGCIGEASTRGDMKPG